MVVFVLSTPPTLENEAEGNERTFLELRNSRLMNHERFKRERLREHFNRKIKDKEKQAKPKDLPSKRKHKREPHPNQMVEAKKASTPPKKSQQIYCIETPNFPKKRMLRQAENEIVARTPELQTPSPDLEQPSPINAEASTSSRAPSFIPARSYSKSGNSCERQFSTAQAIGALKKNFHSEKKSPRTEQNNTLHSEISDTRHVGAELNVLKVILRREFSLKSLEQNVKRLQSLESQSTHLMLVDTLEEQERKRLKSIQQELVKVFQVLVKTLDEVRAETVLVVQAICIWKSKQPQAATKYHAYLWENQNYMFKMNVDVAELLASKAVQYCLKRSCASNPLLLPRQCTVNVGKDQVREVTDPRTLNEGGDQTFLTEQVDLASQKRISSAEASSGSSLSARTQTLEQLFSRVFTPLIEQFEEAQYVEFKRCEELILDEPNQKKLYEEQRLLQQQQSEAAYNPFTKIQASGGVDPIITAFDQKHHLQAEHEFEVLRRRQTNTKRIMPPVVQTREGNHLTRLRVKQAKLQFLKDQNDALANRASHAPEHPVNCKLNGGVLISRHAVRKKRKNAAVKIASQYFVFCHRRHVSSTTKAFLQRYREAAMQVQRLYRSILDRRSFLQRKVDQAKQRVREAQAATKIQRVFRYSQKSDSVDRVAKIQTFKQQQEAALQAERIEKYRLAGQQRRLDRLREREIELERRRQVLLLTDKSARRIQSFYRISHAKTTAYNLRIAKYEKRRHNAAARIQAQARRRIVMHSVDRLKIERIAMIQFKNASKIQAIYRGYHCRRQIKKKNSEQKTPRRTTRRKPPPRVIIKERESTLPRISVSTRLSSPRARSHAPTGVATPRESTRLPLIEPRPPRQRRSSIKMDREELKLNEPQLGDDF